MTSQVGVSFGDVDSLDSASGRGVKIPPQATPGSPGPIFSRAASRWERPARLSLRVKIPRSGRDAEREGEGESPW
jgi:hypothetical protein